VRSTVEDQEPQTGAPFLGEMGWERMRMGIEMIYSTSPLTVVYQNSEEQNYRV
jgi:hypothetical protein